MKRFFLIIVLLTCALTGVFSQNILDVVFLKNGSIIKGLIIEQKPNESVKIVTRDGSMFVYKTSEIDKIVKELSNKKNDNIFSSTHNDNDELSSGSKFFVESGYTFGSDGCGRVELLTSAGYQINKYLYIGAGVGGNYYTEESFMLPIYGNIRCYVPTGTAIHPYADVKSGYSLDVSDDHGSDGGFYINATAGIEFSNYTVGVGYALQSMSSASNGGVAIMVGYTF